MPSDLEEDAEAEIRKRIIQPFSNVKYNYEVNKYDK